MKYLVCIIERVIEFRLPLTLSQNTNIGSFNSINILQSLVFINNIHYKHASYAPTENQNL